MPPIRFGVADLTGGVSTQPDALRYPSQVEDADNCLMTFGRGLQKRPGTVGYTTLASAPGSATSVAVHWVEISSSVRLCLIFQNDGTTPLRAYKTDGTAVTVNYVDAGAKAYLAVANPSTNLRFASLGVTTLVMNKTVTTATKNNSSAPYQYSGTNVSNSANAHNKATWDDFDQPPASTNQYWYARQTSTGHLAGWWKSVSTSDLPWYEQVATEATDSLVDETTMPVKIVWNGTQLDVSYVSWSPRYSGDNTTNPRADFFGKTLTDLCFHRGRLWLAAGDVVCSSQADDLYNFWTRDWENPATAADPIQLSTSSTGEVANVTFLMPFRQSLVVFCDSGLVMEATSQDTLTPDSVVWQPSYRVLKIAGRPDVMGNRLYFVSNWSSGDKLHEHASVDNTIGGDVEDVSLHVSGYLPDGTATLEVGTSNMAFIRFDDEPTSLYAYQSLIVGDQRVQSAYHRWTFHTAITSHYVFDNTLFLLMRTASTVWLETLDVADLRPEYASEVHHIHMDRKHKKTGVYSSATNRTTWTKDYSDTSALTVYLGAEWIPANRHGTVLTATSTGATTMTVPGDWSDYPAIVGRTYEAEATLSKPRVRDQNGAVVVGNLHLTSLSVHLEDTGHLQATVTTQGGTSRTETYTGKRVGTALLNTNEISPKGQFDINIFESSDSATVTLHSDSVTPFNITGLEFIGRFNPGRRTAANS